MNLIAHGLLLTGSVVALVGVGSLVGHWLRGRRVNRRVGSRLPREFWERIGAWS